MGRIILSDSEDDSLDCDVNVVTEETKNNAESGSLDGFTTPKASRTPMAMISEARANAREAPKSARRQKKDDERALHLKKYKETQPLLEQEDVTFSTIVNIWTERRYSNKNEWQGCTPGCEPLRSIIRDAAVEGKKKRRTDEEFTLRVEQARQQLLQSVRGHSPPHSSMHALRECVREEIKRLWQSNDPREKLGALQVSMRRENSIGSNFSHFLAFSFYFVLIQLVQWHLNSCSTNILAFCFTFQSPTRRNMNNWTHRIILVSFHVSTSILRN